MEKLEPYALLVGMSNGATARENRMEVSKKLRIELPYDPAIPLLGIYLKKLEIGTYTDTFTPMFTASSFRIVKVGSNPSVHWCMNE